MQVLHEALSQNLTYDQMGVVLCGSTNEVRGLGLSTLASLGGVANSEKVHAVLKGHDYDRDHIMKPGENIWRTCERTPGEIVTTTEDSSEITLNDYLGQHAVAFYGVLVKELPRDINLGFCRLVGINKSSSCNVPSPQIRRTLLNTLVLGKQAVTRAGAVSITSTVLDCPPGHVRKHVETLERFGLVTMDAEKVLRLSPNYKPAVEAFVDLATCFQTDEQLRREGSDYILNVVTGEHTDSKRIPDLVNRSVVQSGRSHAPAIEKFIALLPKYIRPGETIASSEVAQRLGQDGPVVYELLQRMERSAKDRAPIYRVNSIINGSATRVKERLWTLKSAA